MFSQDTFVAFPCCSPEHPLMRAKGRSILGGDRQSFQEYTDRVTLRFASVFFIGVVLHFLMFFCWRNYFPLYID